MQRGGSKPGERRGGRQKGAPNKRTQEISDRVLELGRDPLEGMAQIAIDTRNSPDLRANRYGRALPSARSKAHVRHAAGGERRF